MLAQLEESIPFPALELLQVEDILVKLHRRLHVIDLDGQMIASVNLHAHALTLTALGHRSMDGALPVAASLSRGVFSQKKAKTIAVAAPLCRGVSSQSTATQRRGYI